MQRNRIVYLVIGYMLAGLAVGMVPPFILDLISGQPEARGFLVSAGLTAFVAVALILTNRGSQDSLTTRQAFLLISWSWVVLTFFAALPFILAGQQMDVTNAFFEAMSGLTTTGATVMTGLDDSPPGILLWRGQLQWFGGIGIIVMAISVLPLLNVGGMQLFRAETGDTSDKILPRTQQITGSIFRVYVLLTLACAGFYWIAGMSLFDALVHSMTTVSTGGFSSHDASFGYFDSVSINMIASFFMIIAALPFVNLLGFVNGRRHLLTQDSQTRAFLAIIIVCIILIMIFTPPAVDFSQVVFNVASIITGTGYSTTDYDNWGAMAITLFLALTLLGGCAGSTSCGLKIFRLQVAVISAWRYLRQLSAPHAVFVARYNRRLLPDSIAQAVIAFTLIYFFSFAVVAMILTLLGLDMITAISAAASCIANVGPGLGPEIGPAGNFSNLSPTVKWVLSGAMLLGRLEFLSVLVTLTPSFWRR